MAIKIVKNFLTRKKIFFCDRCGGLETEDWANFKTLCDSCYNKPPETVKPQTITDNYFFPISLEDTPPKYIPCSICQKILGKRSDIDKIECKHVCNSCVSRHPDTTHFEFQEPISDFFLKKEEDSTILVRHCIYCGGALVIHIESGRVTYTYFKVGSSTPTNEPFICTKNLPAQDGCKHNWIMLAGSEQNKGLPLEKIREIRDHPDPIIQMSYSAYLTDQRHWCSRCGMYYQVPKESLPEVGNP
jgi:hypothetical protein